MSDATERSAPYLQVLEGVQTRAVRLSLVRGIQVKSVATALVLTQGAP